MMLVVPRPVRCRIRLHSPFSDSYAGNAVFQHTQRIACSSLLDLWNCIPQVDIYDVNGAYANSDVAWTGCARGLQAGLPVSDQDCTSWSGVGPGNTAATDSSWSCGDFFRFN